MQNLVIYSFSLAQRKRTKRDIHPLQGLPLYGEDAIDFGPCPKSRFWYDSQSFRPSGVSHGLFLLLRMQR